MSSDAEFIMIPSNDTPLGRDIIEVGTMEVTIGSNVCPMCMALVIGTSVLLHDADAKIKNRDNMILLLILNILLHVYQIIFPLYFFWFTRIPHIIGSARQVGNDMNAFCG